MPEPRFDPLIHAPHRLRICAMLSQADAIEFAEIQDRIALSKSALSKHLSQLGEAGYTSEETFVRAGRARMSVSLTDAGRAAYLAHRAALAQILDEASEPQESAKA